MGSVANLGKPENCSGPYMGQLTGSPTRCTQSPVTYSYWGCCGYRYYRYRCIQYGINTPDRQSADGELPLNWWSRAHPSASARMAAPDQARTRVRSRRPRGRSTGAECELFERRRQLQPDHDVLPVLNHVHLTGGTEPTDTAHGRAEQSRVWHLYVFNGCTVTAHSALHRESRWRPAAGPRPCMWRASKVPP